MKVCLAINKSDIRSNPITVKEQDGPGPDDREIVLLQKYDTLTLVSNGAGWWVVQDNRMPERDVYVDNSAAPGGTYQASMLHRLYLVSAFEGQIIFELPEPNQAVGRLATIKKIDPSGNSVKIQQAGGSGGPDAQIFTLLTHFAALTIYSDGGQWVVLSGY